MAYLMANTSNVYEMKFGRPQSIIAPKELPNCAIVTLDALNAGDDHVRTVKPEAKETAVGQFVIVAPEVNVEQYRMVDNSIAKFSLEQGEIYSAYELKLLDRLEFSADYFTPSVPSVGQTVKIAADGKLTGHEADGCLKVISVREQRLPMVMINGVLSPASVKMVKVEVVK